jgi:hypothetical protein
MAILKDGKTENLVSGQEKTKKGGNVKENPK